MMIWHRIALTVPTYLPAVLFVVEINPSDLCKGALIAVFELYRMLGD